MGLDLVNIRSAQIASAKFSSLFHDIETDAVQEGPT